MLINGVEVSKGLIIKRPWVNLILDGLIVGLANLTDSLGPLSKDKLIAAYDKHKVDYAAMPELLKWCNPWVLENAHRIEPVPYQHKSGAVTWVNI
ncbi:hypothetical protein [Vibrio parahaemolyticus]|uniref:hypothetical protein n=1 Tax=Vibrio parahaemolyticus TaxID=670 RepID=UPI00084B6165|nr:hypothetical protein [Vibrio parahaemolyticus]EJG2035861.1 hypothetical protein [Vibrio parahaemolyticus]EJG2233155.1 hypothetical protein [Vibrio parahaemolyticus]ODY59197.1 hypothetical protein BBM96_06910 [Vibrio parahaemolyticus]ODY61973.1 hypothetical protein BBM26_02300 [Vibrio parahaemolyticus]ODY65646.1 hypothetical protein BBM97_06855 [Vibrio parahaemolyticus]